MNQEQLYSERIKNLEREIRNLKTAHFKTATTISTMETTVGTAFSLTLDSLSGQIYSTQRAVITLTTTDGTDMISACYLEGVDPSNLNNRFAFVKRIQSPAGTAKFDVTVFSQNADDYNTLAGGGSVNLSYTLRLVGSSRFNATVTYRSIDGGSS